MLFPLFILLFKLNACFCQSICFRRLLVDRRSEGAFFEFCLKLFLFFSFSPFLLFFHMMHVDCVKINWTNLGYWFWSRLWFLNLVFLDMMFSRDFCVNERFEMLKHLWTLLRCQCWLIVWLNKNVLVLILPAFEVAFNDQQEVFNGQNTDLALLMSFD